MQLQKKHIIPIAIFLFSLILRVALISKGPYHGDTIALMIQAQKTIDTLQLQKQSALGFPLIVILASLFISGFRFLSFGTPALAVNSISVLFSSLAVLGFYFLSLEIYEHFHRKKDQDFAQEQRLVAIIASLLLSISPIFLGISVYGKNHAPCMFFLIMGIFQLLKYLRTQRKKTFIASIISFGLMGATRMDILVLAAPLSFAFLSLHPRQPKMQTTISKIISWFPVLKNFCVWWISILLCIFLFYVPYFFNESVASFTASIKAYYDTYLVNNYLGLFSYKLFRTFNYLVKNFTYAGLIFSLLGIIRLFRKNKKATFFLLLWFGFPFFQYGNLLTTVSSRYFVILLPPIIFAMAYAFNVLSRKNALSRAIAFISLFAIGLTTFIRIYPLLEIRHQYEDVPAFVRWFKEKAKPDAQMIHADGSIFFKYYANVTTIRRPLSAETIAPEKLEKFRNKINDLLAQGIPVYINDAGLYSYNAESNFSNFIIKNYDLKYLGSHYYEDWHSGAMQNKRFNLKVYELQRKANNE